MPSYMVDCALCGSQTWAVDEQTGRRIRVTCTQPDCDGIQAFALTDDGDGFDCLTCRRMTWVVSDQTDDHIMLRCANCADETEIWLREADT